MPPPQTSVATSAPVPQRPAPSAQVCSIRPLRPCSSKICMTTPSAPSPPPPPAPFLRPPPPRPPPPLPSLQYFARHMVCLTLVLVYVILLVVTVVLMVQGNLIVTEYTMRVQSLVAGGGLTMSEDLAEKTQVGCALQRLSNGSLTALYAPAAAALPPRRLHQRLSNGSLTALCLQLYYRYAAYIFLFIDMATLVAIMYMRKRVDTAGGSVGRPVGRSVGGSARSRRPARRHPPQEQEQEPSPGAAGPVLLCCDCLRLACVGRASAATADGPLRPPRLRTAAAALPSLLRRGAFSSSLLLFFSSSLLSRLLSHSKASPSPRRLPPPPPPEANPPPPPEANPPPAPHPQWASSSRRRPA
jgi:hypothetical protein